MTTKQLFAKLTAALENDRLETPEPGFRTRLGWAKEFGCGGTKVHEIIQQQTRLGGVICKKFRIQVGGKIQPIPHYKFKV